MTNRDDVPVGAYLSDPEVEEAADAVEVGLRWEFRRGVAVRKAATVKAYAVGLTAGRAEAVGLLKTLVEKLDAVHADPKYKGVWVLYDLRGMRYEGPTYKEELEKARAYLQAQGEVKE